MATKTENTEVVVKPLSRGRVNLRIIGENGFFFNKMSAKARQQLLIGGGRKTAAEKVKIKHDPYEEFLESAYVMPEGETALGLRNDAIKAAMATAALETEGVFKTTVQRLVYIPNEFSFMYGTPQLRMDVVRSAGVNRAPDIRTRAFLPKWGAEVTITFVHPQLAVSSVVNLLANAGVVCGVGDFRQEKGKGSFGTFRVLGEGQEDEEWDDLIANHGRGAQEAALAEPEYANTETAELMKHFFGEQQRRAA